MGFDNKPNLNNKQFNQLSGDTMRFYGTNIISRAIGATSGGTISSNTGYQVSGTTVFDTGDYVSALQIGCGTYAKINAVAVGANAKACCDGSIAIGQNAIAKSTDDISIGTDAGSACVGSGFKNIAIGFTSLNNNTNGVGNIAMGSESLFCNTTGNYNIAQGYLSLYCNTSGCYNIAKGVSALYCNGTGRFNIGLGWESLYNNIAGNHNIAIGCRAGFNETGSGKLFIATGSTRNLIYGDFITNEVTLPTLKLCTTPVNGNSATDSTLVWNPTTCTIGKLPYSSGGTGGSGILSAENGLTKIGTNVSLGGALTGNTSITGNYTLNINCGAKLNTTCGYQISGVTMLKASSHDNASIFIGPYAGSNGSGKDNLAMGNQALYSNTTGSWNVALGSYSLYWNTIGSGNTTQGYLAMASNTSGCHNVALGTSALYYNTTGCDNIAFGNGALFNNTVGYSNVAINNSALWDNRSGCYNIGIGDQAGSGIQTGSHNIAIGWQSLTNSVAGKHNIGIGCRAGFNETGSGKLFIATGSTRNLIYGDFITNSITLPKLCICDTPATGACTDAVLIWNSTDKCVKQISSATLIGAGILTANNGLNKAGTNVRLGGALTGNTSITGNYSLNICSGAKLNTACGYQISGTTVFRTGRVLSNMFLGGSSGNITGTGTNNIGIGGTSLASISTGFNNIGIGNEALSSNSTGCNNIGVGSGVLPNNSFGCSNIAIASCALIRNSTGSRNIAIGDLVLCSNTIGSNNIAIGHESQVNSSAGINNITIGYQALYGNSNGSNNIAIGCMAGFSDESCGKLYIATGGTRNLIYGDFITNEVTLPTLKLCTTPVNGNNVTDSALVWNPTTCMVGILPYSSGGTGGSILTANNGLNKAGSNVRLGGALTGNTTITGAYTLNICSGAKLNTQCGYQISGLTVFRTVGANIFVGDNAGTNGSGTYNIGVGVYSLFSNTIGLHNNAYGYGSLYSNTTGCYNSAYGYVSLFANLGGCFNAAFGYCALKCNNSGNYNTGIGNASLALNTSGLQNSALGNSSLTNNTTGCCNVGIGTAALNNNSTGCFNTAIGVCSGFQSTGSCNVYLGAFAGSTNTASNKLFIGNCNICSLISGDFVAKCVDINGQLKVTGVTGGNSGTDCVVMWNPTDKLFKQVSTASLGIGSSVLSANNGLTKDGTNVRLGGNLTGGTTITGNHTLSFCSGAKLNTQCGYQISGQTILKTSSNTLCSVFIGYQSGNVAGSGAYNVGIGACALVNPTTSAGNVGIGFSALLNTNGSGVCNIGIGVSALQTNTTGFSNVGIGGLALFSNTTGFHNIGLGNSALQTNNIGRYNVALGASSLYLNASGCDNVAIGNQAGYKSTGSNNVFLGRCAGYHETTANKLHIANSTGCTLIYGDFTTNAVTLPTLLLCVTPSVGVCTDKVLVRASDGTVKQLPYSSGGTGGGTITGAGNGLSVSGNKIILGGLLTGNTTLSGNYSVTMPTVCSTGCTHVGTNLIMTTANGSGISRCICFNATSTGSGTGLWIAANAGASGSAGGVLYLRGGGTTSGSAGNVDIAGGTANTSGTGGCVIINGGYGSTTAGTTRICGGNSANGGGPIYICGGGGTSGVGGATYICGGLGTGGNIAGTLYLCGGNALAYSGAGAPVCIVGGIGTSCADVYILSGTQLRLQTNSNGVKVTGVLSGTSSMYASNFILTSDERLKTNIQPITICPVCADYKQFELISEPNQVRYGVVAQELQIENPELVRTDDNGMLSVAYIDLLVKEIAYLKYKISEIEKKIN